MIVTCFTSTIPRRCLSSLEEEGVHGSGGNAKRNLILGTQRGILPQELRVFLASLRSTGCQAEVVVYSAGKSGEGLQAVAKTFDASLVEYDYEELSRSHGPMNLHRFELFRFFLQEVRGGDHYDQVLLCDVRDVFFQQDPFTYLSVEDGIGVAVEPDHLLIGNCSIHARWLSNSCPVYQSEGILEKVESERRSCAGTTIGTRAGILTYLETILSEASRTVQTLDDSASHNAHAWEGTVTTKDGKGGWRWWCNDQGMHNALLWMGMFGLPGGANVTLHGAETSGLATVGTMHNIYINEVCANDSKIFVSTAALLMPFDTQMIEQDGELMTGCGGSFKGCDGGVVASLVHQYDRVKVLVDLVAGLYGSEGEVFETFQERHGLE